MKAEVTLVDFANSLRRFDDALVLDPVDDIHRAGCIQYFEFTFDLAWKSIQSIASFYGLEPIKSPRSAFKAAFSQGWIKEQEPWLKMLEARNRMSHIYNADEALKVYESLQEFRQPFQDLHRRLNEAHEAGL